MGKPRKRKRYSNAKHNPIKQASKINSNELENGCEADILQKIAMNLSSGSSIEKECGCSSLAMVAEKHADLILERKLPKMAAPLMLDKHNSVSHSAVGALVNISLTSPEVCDELVRQDVMTPLCTLLANYAPSKEKHWENKQEVKGEVMDQKAEIFVKAVTLLWNLCEASETALKIFNSKNIIQLLFSYINLEMFGTDVVACVLQCLYSVCENNIPAVSAIKERGVNTLFTGFLIRPQNTSNPTNDLKNDSASILYLRILACGITISVLNDAALIGNEDNGSGLYSEVLLILMETAAKILDQDQRQLIHEYTSLIPVSDNEFRGSHQKKKQHNVPPTEEEMDVHNEEAVEGKVKEDWSVASDKILPKIETMKTEINHVILGQQMTCEILTNLCCDTEPDGGNWEEDSDDMNSSDISEEGYAMMEEENNEMSLCNNRSSNIPTVVLEGFVSHNLVSKVLGKANFPAENACEILKSLEFGRDKNKQDRFGGRVILKMLSTLRSRAFLCVNNMLGSDLSLEDLGGGNALFAVWSNLGLLCFQSTTRQLESESR